MRQPRRIPDQPPQYTVRIATDALDSRPPRPDNAQRRLTDAVRRYGITMPITVAPTDHGRFTVLDGHRRVAIARALGIEAIDCILTEPVAPLRLEGDYFNQAEQLSDYLAAQTMTQEQIARQLGVSQSTVANKLRLLRFTPDERKIIRSADLTERHARAILALPPDRRQTALDSITTGNLTVAKTEALIDSLRRPQRNLPIRGAIRDIGIFYNSIDRALAILHEAGIAATLERVEDGDEVTVTIRVPRETVRC